MSKQSEQILEEQTKTLAFALSRLSLLKYLNINEIKNFSLKMFTEFKKGIIFAATVPALHTVRSASGSFFLYSYGN